MIGSDASRRMGEEIGQGSGWKFHLSLLALAILALLVFYRDAFGSLIHMWWTEGTYSHGVLIFPISLYLIWERRQMLRQVTPSFSPWPLLFVGLVSLLWLAGYVVHARMVEHFAVITFFALLIWLFLGPAVVRRIIFPLFFLYLSIPIWDPIVTPFLQSGTAYVVYKILSVFGVPILLDGHFLTIPEGVFEVARTCAGTRYFIAGFTLSLLYAYLIYQHLLKRVLFVVVAVVLCLLVNTIRVVLVVMAGHLTNMQHPWVEDHITMGWVLFALFIVPLFWLGMRYQDPEERVAVLSESSNSMAGAHFVKGGALVMLAVGGLACGPVLSAYVDQRAAQALSELRLELPLAKQPWQEGAMDEVSWQPLFIGADLERRGVYVLNGESLYYYAAKYAVQTQGKELTDIKVFDRQAWFQKPGGETHVYDVKGLWPHRVQETVIQSGKYGAKVVWQWYSVAGHETASAKQAKFLELAKLFEDEKTSSAIVLAVDGDNLDDGRQLMRRFLTDMESEIRESLLSKARE